MASQPDETPARRERLELFSTLLLAVAAIATAWSSYQATRWNGEQAKAASRTNGARILAARADTLAASQTQVDVATFIQWIEATKHDDAALADFYHDHFRAEFKPAFDAWLAKDPLNDPSAPPTPFAMDEYQLAARQESEKQDQAAAASSAEVQRAVSRAGNYVLAVVLYSVVLFFAGMSTKLTSRRLRIATVAAGYVILVCALAWIATFPVEFSIRSG